MQHSAVACFVCMNQGDWYHLVCICMYEYYTQYNAETYQYYTYAQDKG